MDILIALIFATICYYGIIVIGRFYKRIWGLNYEGFKKKTILAITATIWLIFVFNLYALVS
jgi:hypothetical protein